MYGVDFVVVTLRLAFILLYLNSFFSFFCFSGKCSVGLTWLVRGDKMLLSGVVLPLGGTITVNGGIHKVIYPAT